MIVQFSTYLYNSVDSICIKEPKGTQHSDAHLYNAL